METIYRGKIGYRFFTYSGTYEDANMKPVERIFSFLRLFDLYKVVYLDKNSWGWEHKRSVIKELQKHYDLYVTCYRRNSLEKIKRVLYKDFNFDHEYPELFTIMYDAVSKIDGGYIGDYEECYHLFQTNIDKIQKSHKKNNVCSIGYNKEEKKWYGWSHRAIYGFGIGSSVDKGNIGYMADNKENFIERSINFWDDAYHSYTRFGGENKRKTKFKIDILYNNKVPNPDYKGKEKTIWVDYPKKYGKGEWTAKTLSDAKEMAIDFADAVS